MIKRNKFEIAYVPPLEDHPVALHQLAHNADFQKLNASFKFQVGKIIRQIFRSRPLSISREKRVWLCRS